jgi:hypothetical protein
MGVWGGVIFKPRSDLPDNPPVTVRLQRVMVDFIA